MPVGSLGQEDPLGREWQPTPVFLPGESIDRGAWRAIVHGVAKGHNWSNLAFSASRSKSHISLLTLYLLDLSIHYQSHTEARMIPNLHLINICYISWFWGSEYDSFIPWTEKPGRLQSMGWQSRTPLSDFTFTCFSAFSRKKETCD